MAGIVGIEPTSTVLETAVLPLYYIPRSRSPNNNKPMHTQKTSKFCDIKLIQIKIIFSLIINKGDILVGEYGKTSL